MSFPLPSFYDPKKCGTLFKPDLAGAAAAGAELAQQYGLKASAEDKGKRIILSIIDNQVDFTNPTIGNLFVPGSVEDLDRLCRFVFANVDRISEIFATLDTHYLYQPFHPFTWIAGSKNCVVRMGGKIYVEGDHPDPFTIISLKDVNDDVWRPARRPKRMIDMLRKLESTGKKQLCIWPIHCVLGSPGHALDPALLEALFYHSAARSDQYDLSEKGMSQSAEHYGALQAEAQFDDDPLTQLNNRIINKWQKADRIYFAGQAKSHCVLETLNQTVDIFRKRSPEVLQNLYVLRDCMSSVPDIKDADGNVIVPFDKIAEDRFKELEKLGVKFVKSTYPVD